MRKTPRLSFKSFSLRKQNHLSFIKFGFLKLYFFIVLQFFAINYLSAKNTLECILHIQSDQIDLKNDIYEIEIFNLNVNPVSYGVQKTIRLTSYEQVIKMNLQRIIEGGIKLKKNGLVISERNQIYFSSEHINIFLNEKGITKVESKQNDFRSQNNFLLFSLPASIRLDNDFSVSLFRKKRTAISFPNNYLLQLMIDEYQQKVIRELKKINQYIHTIKALDGVKEYLTLQTLDSCLRILRSFKGISEQYDLLSSFVENLERIQPGNYLPLFTITDANGRNYASKSFAVMNADYVLLDFWASWCVPCRTQMKRFKKIYEFSDTSKFKIISLSFDESKEDWTKAIVQDSVVWKSYIAEGGTYGPTAKLLSISYIPQNILIRKTGEIVDLDLDEQGLLDFVKKNGLSNNR